MTAIWLYLIHAKGLTPSGMQKKLYFLLSGMLRGASFLVRAVCCPDLQPGPHLSDGWKRGVISLLGREETAAFPAPPGASFGDPWEELSLWGGDPRVIPGKKGLGWYKNQRSVSVLSCLGAPEWIPRVVPTGGNLQKVFKRESPDSENLSAKSFVFLMLPQCLELNFKNGIFLERTFWNGHLGNVLL